MSKESLLDKLRTRIAELETGLISTGNEPDDDSFGATATELEQEVLPVFSSPDQSTEAIPLSILGSENYDIKVLDTPRLNDLTWGRKSRIAPTEPGASMNRPSQKSTTFIQARMIWKLPTCTQSKCLVDFHIKYLCCYHNTIHSPSFLDQCKKFWDTGKVQHPLWIAVYLSVLSVSILSRGL